MKQYQKGEAMIAVMVVVVIVMWLSKGHMDMMGMSLGEEHAGKSDPVAQQMETRTSSVSAPNESIKHQH